MNINESNFNEIQFKDITPTDFLRDLRVGLKQKKLNAELELVQGLLFKYAIKPELLNVVIYYILKKKGEPIKENNTEPLVRELLTADIHTAEKALNYFEMRKRKPYSTFKEGNDAAVGNFSANVETYDDKAVNLANELRRDEDHEKMITQINDLLSKTIDTIRKNQAEQKSS